MMDIKELPARRERLESQIREACAALIDGFKDDTGLDVSSVEIEFMDVSSAAEKRLIISHVTVKLEIE